MNSCVFPGKSDTFAALFHHQTPRLQILNMVIGENKVVLVHYTLTEGTATGQQIESTLGSEPLGFIFGTGSMIPDFEKNLTGKKAGDRFSFGIKAADAYGEQDATAIVEIPKNAFGLDEKTADEIFIVGNMLPLQDQEGHPMDGLVKAVSPTSVTIDFNHPMAGVDLYFTGHIESVREATHSELEHGHVHGHGGHHH